MKYVITESQIDTLIMKQLDKMFDVSNINWTHPYEYDENGEEFEDSERMDFYFGDYGDDSVFMWYGKGYWGDNQHDYRGYKSKSPIVDIEEPYHSYLNGLFGNRWYEPFKVWFKENFNVNVKTVMDEVYNK